MNLIKLIGTYNKETGNIQCKRLSDNYDTIPVRFNPQEEESIIDLLDGDRVFLEGTIANDKGTVFVEVEEINILEEGMADTTECELRGVIKKVYPLRTTKKGRELQDMLIEAQGELIKVVVFEACPDFIKPGISVHIKGRLQSRSFTQVTTFGTVDKTVYEVALKNLEVIDGEEYKN